MIRIFFAFTLLAAVFGLLFGPSFWVARRLRAQGDVAALGCLRVVWPLQLVGGAGLCFLADFLGLGNPAGYIAAIMLAVSLGGAAIFAACRRTWLAWRAWRSRPRWRRAN